MTLAAAGRPLRFRVMHSSPRPNRWYRVLYVQVLIAVLLGVVVGYFWPEFGKSLKPLGDAFIKLVKMIIAPIIFCTVVHGIASMSDLKKLGRIGGKSLLYFEVISTLALVVLVLAAFVAIGSALAVSAAGRVYIDLLFDQWNSFVFWLENLFS